MAASKASRITRGHILGVGVLVFVLVLVAMGVSTTRKVRANSLRSHIECDLFSMLCAADQFYLETGKTSATYDDIVGPTKWIGKYPPEFEKHYRTLQFHAGQGISVRWPDGTVYSAKLKK
jgi:hypothetical protein